MTDLGFDEGGVLQALASPIIHVEEARTSKNGRKITTTTFELTGAHLVALLLGRGLLALFYKFKDLSPEEQEYAKNLLLYGPLSSWVLKKTSEPPKEFAQMTKKPGLGTGRPAGEQLL